jgi:hypothetical protein
MVYLFIEAWRENHEVFSLVDERRASPLTSDILTDSLLTDVSKSTADVSITPKCPLFPELRFQRFAHAFVIPERSISVFMDGQEPAVTCEVRFSPSREDSLDLLQSLQKQHATDLPFLQAPAFPHLQRKPAAFCDPSART